MSNSAKTIYLDDDMQRRALETAKKLKAKGVHGLFKDSGELNMSALVQYFIRNASKFLDTEAGPRKLKDIQ